MGEFPEPAVIRVPRWFQGPTDAGQGGWTAAKFVAAIGGPATVALRSPIPLDTDLSVVEVDDGWHLVDGSFDPSSVVLAAKRWEPEFAPTVAVSVDEAVLARARFPLTDDQHPVPNCFSCGLAADSMHVHGGPLDDGRFACDWRVPTWAVDGDGAFDPACLWAALDCAAAWYVCCDGEIRRAFTVQFAVEVIEKIDPTDTYVLVAWHGDSSPAWDGRKRGAASAAFSSDGRCVARSRSFWVSAVDG